MGNRAKAMKVLKGLDLFMPGSPNYDIVKQRLEAMTDAQFDAFMQRMRSGDEVLPLYQPNLSQYKLTVDGLFDVGQKLGHEFFHHVIMIDPTTGLEFTTPEKYLVVDLMVRRQQQHLVKKISIPESNMHVDELTGQPTGPSKGSKMSAPEIQILYAQGLESTIEEFIKVRGGDNDAYRQIYRDIVSHGSARQESVRARGTRVRSTETLSVLLKSIHLQNNV